MMTQWDMGCLVQSTNELIKNKIGLNQSPETTNQA